jgi:Fe-S cluster assembly protein SufD
MVQVLAEHARYLRDFERFEQDGAERQPSWLHQIRKAAIARFAELGFPTTRLEDWKYTSVAPIARCQFEPARQDPTGVGAEALAGATLAGVACAELVFVNGHYSWELSAVRSLPGAVKAGSLARALAADHMSLQPYLARHARYDDHAFVALNTAFMRDGACVIVQRGAAIESPIHLVFVSRPSIASRHGGEQTGTVSHPRNLILIGDGSQARIVESYVGAGTGVCFTNAVTEIVGGENAVIDYYRVQLEDHCAFHVSTVQVVLARNAVFRSHAIDVGGALVRNDLNVVLGGEGIDCTLNGLFMVAGSQHVDNHTRIDHVRPHCSSRELYKGILDGQSRGVFNGKIYVHKDAQKTDAKQTNKNLLLSEDAVINTKPQLEIYADDVRCSHGSTIGQLDQDAMFYLRSRGIGSEAARSLLTYAFAAEMLERVEIEPIRARLERLVLTRFQTGS